MTINIIALIGMTLTALWAVMARSLLKATIGLAVSSAFLTILMFRLASPLAAVFELSVCTGLITAVFVSAISLTKPLSHAETIALSKNKFRRYWPLPVIMAVVGALLILAKMQFAVAIPQGVIEKDVRDVMWNLRQIDMYGQIILMLAGAFGVVILFRERNNDKR